MSFSGNNDTITALATPLGEGAIGVIRLSGPQSRDILKKIFRGSLPVDHFESHKLYLGGIVYDSNSPHPPLNLRGGGSPEGARGSYILDQALVVWFAQGNSFTGEEVVEIQAHGSPVVLQQILKILVQLGARLAEPGEFSKRAFLNGKMDLTQAEAIADLISAKSEWEAKNALLQLGGQLSMTIGALRQQLIELLARVEVGFDFSEEDIQMFDRERMLPFLKEMTVKIEILVDSFKTGQLYKDGLRVALIGRPNVGKSSLLNLLLNEDRALVHHEPGTTRDVVSGERKVFGIITTFSDTAGIRETSQSVELAGIERSRLTWEKSDLVLLLLDSSHPLTDLDQTLLREVGSKPCIIIYSKCDLPPIWEPNQKLFSIIQTLVSVPGTISNSFPLVKVSSHQRIGIAEIEDQIYNQMIQKNLTNDHNYVLNNVRYKKILDDILLKLKEITQLLDEGNLADDCLAEELRIMSNRLGGITGEISNEMVLDEIFQKFCIGK